MKFSKTFSGWLHVLAGAVVALSGNEVTGTIPAVQGIIPLVAAPWVGLAVSIAQAFGANKAFEKNWDGSDASAPAPPVKG